VERATKNHFLYAVKSLPRRCWWRRGTCYLATVIGEWSGSRPRQVGSLCQVIAAYALTLISRAGTEGSTVSSLICDCWLILGLKMLSISRCWTTDNRWPPAVCLAGHQWLCSHAPLNWTLGPTVRGAHELWPSTMQQVLVARETVVIDWVTMYWLRWHYHVKDIAGAG